MDICLIALGTRPGVGLAAVAFLALAALLALHLRLRRATTRIAQREAETHKLLEQSSDAIFILDRERNFVDLNSPACELVGYPREHLLTTNFKTVLAAEQGGHHPLRSDELDGKPLLMQRVLQRKDGSVLTVEMSVSRSLNGRLLVIARDITQRLETEDALRRSEALKSTLLNAALDAVVTTDEAGRIIDFNNAAQRLFGYSRSKAVHCNLVDLLVLTGSGEGLEVGPVPFESSVQRLLDRRTELPAVRADGTLFPAEVTIARVLVDEGFLFAVYVRDVTDQLQAHQELLKTEEHVRQLQRIEAVGRLAGGIAHDFNNLLTAILGYSQQLAVSIGADSPLRPNVDEIHRAGERAATLTRQLLAFSRKQTLEPRLLDVNDVIRGMTSLLRSLLGEETELREELMAEPAPVQADRGQLEQIVLNLAVNARDAMPGGGVLTLRTERLDVAPDEPLPDAHVAAGRYVLLQVIDTGIGMDRETQEHAFDPYFSTKEEGRGTGLGLSMVYGFVKQSGGYVYLSSAPSAGTTFRVYFPYIEGAAVAPEEQARPGDHGRRRIETILVAEDNSQVLGLLCTVLQAAGYRVLQAGNGKEALDKATAHDGPIHALVTDLVMPGMSGRELARKVRELRPDTRVLFVSGYAGDELGDRVEPGEALLLKPFNPQELTRRIDELLAGAAGGA